MDLLPECAFMKHVHVWCPQRPSEDIGCPWTGFIDDCEATCGC